MGKKRVPVGPHRSPQRTTSVAAGRRTLPGIEPPSTQEEVDALKRALVAAHSARDEAERSALSKDQFMAVLAHELRTPLAALQMQVHLLRRTGSDPAKLERGCDAIERSVRLQAQLVDDLLDVSRIVSGKLKVAHVPVDVVDVVESTLEAMRTLAETADIELSASVDRSVGSIAGDRVRLVQILSNILGNAIKFTPPGGRVDVVLERSDGLAHLRVTDSGIGIEPHLVKHVFSRLTQSEVPARTHGGLGLGLAIVRYLVDAHGGSIRAESSGRGKGATFHVTLPLLKSTGARPADWRTPSAEGEAVAIPHPRRLAGRTLLVIENDTGMREALVDMLREVGALVSTAETAAAGLALLRELRPEALICELAMPGEDGLEFIRKVRSLGDARGGDTPALALTALVGEQNRRRALEAGFGQYLTKPTDVNRLVEAVASLLEGGARESVRESTRGGRASARDLSSET